MAYQDGNGRSSILVTGYRDHDGCPSPAAAAGAAPAAARRPVVLSYWPIV